MIFVTVGMQMPFPRLISVVDKWAADNKKTEMFAQIGRDPIPPANIDWMRFLSTSRFREVVGSAQLIVGHGGVGTILTAMQYGIPLLVLPRKAIFGETRCDHQIETCSQFSRIGGVEIAFNEDELLSKLDRFEQIRPPKRIGSYASPLLIEAISDFIDCKEI